MKIKFTSLKTRCTTLKVSFDAGETFNKYTTSDVRKNGIYFNKSICNALNKIIIYDADDNLIYPTYTNIQDESFSLEKENQVYVTLDTITTTEISDGSPVKITSSNETEFASILTAIQSQNVLVDISATKIPADVEVINATNVTALTLPFVETITSDLLTNCSSLKTIIVPSTVTKIEAGAFKECSSLEEIILNDSTGWSKTGVSNKVLIVAESIDSIDVSEALIGDFSYDKNTTTSISVEDGIITITGASYEEDSGIIIVE